MLNQGQQKKEIRDKTYTKKQPDEFHNQSRFVNYGYLMFLLNLLFSRGETSEDG